MSIWGNERCECGRGIQRRSHHPPRTQCSVCARKGERKRKRKMTPCPGCGTQRHTADIERGGRCMTCLRATKAEHAELKELMRIDWLAIELVIEGHAQRLNAEERKIVVRQMESRLWLTNSGTNDIPPGFVTSEDLATRMGCLGSNIAAIRKRLPKATRHRCPECRGYMWVIDETGVVEEHSDGYFRCPVSGSVFRELVSA